MSAYQDSFGLQVRLRQRTPHVTIAHAHTLRRAEMTLHRWAELECGDSNDFQSWAIERDEKTDKPFMVRNVHSTGRVYRAATPDREAGAIKRVEQVCKELGLFYYHQTDPRGCALYVSNEPLTDSNYSSRGVACCV